MVCLEDSLTLKLRNNKTQSITIESFFFFSFPCIHCFWPVFGWQYGSREANSYFFLAFIVCWSYYIKELVLLLVFPNLIQTEILSETTRMLFYYDYKAWIKIAVCLFVCFFFSFKLKEIGLFCRLLKLCEVTCFLK